MGNNSYGLLKNEIPDLIEAGKIEESKNKIKEYTQKIGVNAEIYSFLAIIGIIEKNFIDAEKALRKGLELEPENVDLLFNYAYLYQQNNNIELAYKYYEQAKRYTQDKGIIAEINQLINELNSSKENFPKISIIITSFNQKDKLKRAVDSAINQTYKNTEIIIVDDCSTDGTDKLIEIFQREKRVKFIKNPTNFGVIFNAMHSFYNYASGDYVIFIDHDDYLVDNLFLENAVKLLNANSDLSMVVANCFIHNEETGAIIETGYNMETIIDGKEYFLRYKSEKYPNITSGLTTLFRRKNAMSMGCFKEVTHSKDLFLHLKLMLTGNVGFLKEHVGVYTLHKKNLSKSLPIEFDYTTINELKALNELCLSRGFTSEEMDNWLENQIFLYLQWRFFELWNVSKRGEALELLAAFKSIYPNPINRILMNI